MGAVMFSLRRSLLKFGNNVDMLLEKVLIQAELLELKANADKSLEKLSEAALDKGRGYVATMLVRMVRLKLSDYVLAGKKHGKVKAIV